MGVQTSHYKDTKDEIGKAKPYIDNHGPDDPGSQRTNQREKPFTHHDTLADLISLPQDLQVTPNIATGLG